MHYGSKCAFRGEKVKIKHVIKLFSYQNTNIFMSKVWISFSDGRISIKLQMQFWANKSKDGIFI